jgi:hypothetical protein
MSKGKPNDTPIENLLKKTFMDDLPPEVEKAMGEQLDDFRMKIEEEGSYKIRAGHRFFHKLSYLKEFQWIRLIFRKEVLVVASLLLIVLGGFLQSSGSSNRLAQNLSVLGTAVAVSNQVNQSQSMECLIQMSGEAGKPIYYSIHWLSPNLSKIHIKSLNNQPLKTIWLLEKEIVIANHVEDTLQKAKRLDQLIDPMLQPIFGYLAPKELTERMFGEWQLKQYEQQDENKWGTYTISLPGEKALLEATVDLYTYLPIRFKKILPEEDSSAVKVIMSAQYFWNVPISPELMSPQLTKKNPKKNGE